MGSETITFISNDKQEFDLPFEAAKTAGLVEDFFESSDDNEENNDGGKPNRREMEFPRVEGRILSLIVDFLKHHNEEQMKEIPVPLGGSTFDEVMDQEWYKEFAHALSQNKTLFEVLTAANYMNIKPLLDLACLEITFKLTGMSAEQVRVYLNLPQLTAEQEAEARERHPWIFESH
ncbi:predicted protein [Phaeodactylum tricornutum CCAP 1055/1]|jgi:S-phase kinase-associated protein 1|uniref:Uncharacterized protein n=2 Tax=Phaeodactylum tricornutum TaxID=2850 RepID=B5Y5I2_PHATC|nr:predicted protein [Phaeodactylum tricornutum CCAP 1055/1]ACI65657.1 predicted protein [Phaeodactylum tricornutum CCAP 1055/1]|eukprot:XP_002186187.1 predicted protein [Phaeodactylum tricornutum CCAP 1055/1]